MKTIPYSFSRIRNIKTSEIGVIVSQSRGSFGSFYDIFWPSVGEVSKLKCPDNSDSLPEGYEYVVTDYSGLKDNVMHYLQTTLLRRGILDVVARRMCPGYFEPGRLVYFNVPGFLPYGVDRFGPEYPYVILSIEKSFRSKDRDLDFLIFLSKYSSGLFSRGQTFEELRDEIMKSPFRNGILEVPYSLEDYSDCDAYHILSRYDLEY